MKSAEFQCFPQRLRDISVHHNPFPSFAARLTAFTMALYPVHLHRLPDNPSLIAFSSGSGFLESNAWEARIIPGMQNPHCTAETSP
ncbi:MAG: hypothetical protein M0P35_09565 [Bacteroidales bacterium]|nr:hypothetical protein [Bacteroidales bacterium]